MNRESVSATTRKPRDGEIDGVNYYFLSDDEFKKLIEKDGLLEYAVYNNCYYGTPVKGVNEAIKNGKICVLIIDVQGAENVKKIYPDSVSIFLVPPSWETLEQRLRARNSDEGKEGHGAVDLVVVFQTAHLVVLVQAVLQGCFESR